MKTRQMLYALLSAFVLGGFTTSAYAVLIDFDAHASTTQLNGTPPAGAVVTDDYASLGVVFGQVGVSAGVAVVNNSNTFSTPNGACSLTAGGDLQNACAGDIYFNFVNPVDGTTNAFTDYIDFYIGDGGGDTDLWTVNVFGIGGELLESRDISSAANINAAFNHVGMHRFEILDTSGNDAGYLLDNLSFNSPGVAQVPTPGTLLLLGLGLFGMRLAKKNKH